jgi:hypothetical protein
MERGTDWEHRAVRKRWDELDRERQAADRLLIGCLSLFIGVILIGIAASSVVCGFTPGGAAVNCQPGVSGFQAGVFSILGIELLAGGIWFSWTALKQDS